MVCIPTYFFFCSPSSSARGEVGPRNTQGEKRSDYVIHAQFSTECDIIMVELLLAFPDTEG